MEEPDMMKDTAAEEIASARAASNANFAQTEATTPERELRTNSIHGDERFLPAAANIPLFVLIQGNMF